MEYKAVFEEQVSLNPKDMRVKIESVEDLIRDKLQARLEGRCSRHGYVEPGTVTILSRSMGSLEKGRFTGSFIFNVQAEGMVLNPPDGTILEGEVIRKNKMGIYVSYKDAIRVIVPRDLHIGDEAFEMVEIGEKVQVEIKKSRFQVNDPYILSVGLFRSSKGMKAVNAVKPVDESIKNESQHDDVDDDEVEEEGEEEQEQEFDEDDAEEEEDVEDTLE